MTYIPSLRVLRKTCRRGTGSAGLRRGLRDEGYGMPASAAGEDVEDLVSAGARAP